MLDAIRRHLQTWLDFFNGADSLSAPAAQAIVRSHSIDDLQKPLEQFNSRLEGREFAAIESWSVEQRREILAELHSMHRLEYLVSQLNRWLAQIPGPAPSPAR